ncbi:MAG TPA: right-handed parallel beta-helix repeat-containing protein, partial [Acidimicrobiales bacterium]|nr:right-handed parallel beta-helix repeat-containing protein [Acidimicrobiales bacterium]
TTPATTTPPPTSPPPTGGFPNASNTGVRPGVTLQPSGSINVTQDGAVLQNLHITGTVTIDADDVTIRNTLIDNTGTYPIRITSGRNLVVEDSEIDGNGLASVAILSGEYTLRRVDIWDVRDGPRIEGNNVLIEDSYIHHLHRIEGGHHDAIQIRHGVGIVLRHNNLQAYNPVTGDPMNASIQIGSLNGPLSGLVVDGNLMNGGNYTINAGKSSPDPSYWRNNRFGRNFRYGVITGGPGVVWESSNVYDDNGQPVR